MNNQYLFFKNKFVIFICLIVIGSQTSCQISMNNKMFHDVIVPDSVRYSLGQYIQEMEGQEDLQLNISILNTMTDSVIFSKGAYYFKRMSSHSFPRIFVFDGNQIFILKNDSVEGLLDELNIFFKERNIPMKEKAFYLKGVLKFIENNLSELES